MSIGGSLKTSIVASAMAMADDVSHCSKIFEKVQFNFGKLAQFATIVQTRPPLIGPVSTHVR